MEENAGNELVFYVNGRKITEKNADPEMTLLQYLRQKLRLTGSKLGCSEGGCGACTVMVSGYNRDTKNIYHISVNACLAPVCSMHGLAVTTVEGIGSTKTKLHPVQERLAKSFGSQCGFCTPGIVMSMYTLLRNNHQPTAQQIENAFEGNLCRCTGYRPILDGFKTFSKEYQCGLGDQCCKNKQNKVEEEEDTVQGLYDASEFQPFDPSQEAIFPSELQLSNSLDTTSLVFRTSRVTWYRPASLDQLLSIKAQYPDAKIVVGNTEVGIEMKFKGQLYPVLICPSAVRELHSVDITDTGVTFGAATSLATIEHTLKSIINQQAGFKTRIYEAIVEMLRWFAGHQVRNVAAVGGNIMTASPISDLNPIFLAAGCTLTVTSKGSSRRTVVMDETFFKGYRKIAIQPEETLLSVHIPYTQQDEYFFAYKQAHRRDDDIAIVNAGMLVKFVEGTDVVERAALAFGGMAPFTKMAVKTMKQLEGKSWSEDSLVPSACELLREDLPLPPGTPGGMEPYRSTLTLSFFYKFHLATLQELSQQPSNKPTCLVPTSHSSAASVFTRAPTQGVQLFSEVTPGQLQKDPVGRPMMHVSAAKQASGEAVYCDDLTPSQDELYLALVISSVAHADIVSIDWTEALDMPGVVTQICARDIPGSNMTGSVVMDEEIFATKEVTYMGQIIGGIVANTYAEAQRAAKVVKIVYKEKTPILTIKQAIEAQSFLPKSPKIVSGNVDEGFSASAHVFEGEFRMGGQEHFYLETHASIARPTEDGEMEVIASTQAPTTTQELVASALGVPSNRVQCRVKRLGGGFGGKETRSTSVSVPVAVAANKLNRPVRCSFDRDEDMVITGTRHPFYTKYKVGYNDDGKIIAVEANLYSNGGNSMDLSMAVVERAVLSFDNCYKVPHMKLIARVCKTNTPSNTAFRGFGGPQGMMVMENIVDHVARELKMETHKVQRMNFYECGDRTHFNQLLEEWHIPRCWDEVIQRSEYLTKQKQQVQEFNSANRWRKQAVALTPSKFGISFTAPHLNQAGALVHIYTDGSVLLSHCGVEMGQGLHTKMIQVASRALDIDQSHVYIAETSTQCVPNSSPTAASTGSDLNGMAVLKACETLSARLAPFKSANPDGKWEEWVKAAYMDRINLSANGFYRTPDIGYDWEKKEGSPFSYFTQGAAVSKVEIDCLTGDHTVLQTNIVMDVGQSLNPGIDIGQIEGAFMQGYGLVTLEEQRYTPSGYLLTRGPGFYKIPGFADIPTEFNVVLLKGSTNTKAVYSSKAIGEPPLFLAASVFFAIKEAIAAARTEAGLDGNFRLDSPATAERIRMACSDQFTKKCPEGEEGTFKPWFVRLDD